MARGEAGDRPERDERRAAWLLANGVRTLRVSAALVLNDVDDATPTIIGYLEEHGLARERRSGLEPPPSRRWRAETPPP